MEENKKIRSPRIKKEDRQKSEPGISILAKIKALRKERGLSQKEMGEKIGLKIFTYAKIESGENPLSIDRFLEILKVLEVKSYNQVLPEINNDATGEIEKIMINGAEAFEQIHKSSMYVQKLIDGLNDKLQSGDKNDLKELTEDVQLIGSFLSTIRIDSLKNGYTFRSVIELINKID